MNRFRFASAAALCSVLLAACAAGERTLSSVDYQQESSRRIPGHNLYNYDVTDSGVSQRVNRYGRSAFMHERHQTHIERLREALELDKAARKLGREPGSLFRR
jgi:hypothetical protein